LRILCYHGFELENEVSFRPKLFIKRETFLRRLVTLQQYKFCVIPLAKAINSLQTNTLQANTVVITIDDGFYGVLACATPILKKFKFSSE